MNWIAACAAAVLILSVCVAVDVPAQDGDGGDIEKKTACSTEQSISAFMDSDDNVFSYDANKAKDTIYRFGYSAEIECEPDDRNMYRLEFDYEKNDFEVGSKEDFSDSDIELEYERYFSGGRWAGVDAALSITQSSLYAEVSTPGKESDWKIRYGVTVNPRTTVELFYSGGNEDYDFSPLYSINDDSDSDFGAWGLEAVFDAGGFTYLELSYEHSHSDYPGSFLLDADGYETELTRSDSGSMFSAIISKTFAIYPLSFLEIGVEKASNSSNSNEFYDWYSVDGGIQYWWKVVPGYNDYDDLNWYIYFARDVTPRTLMTLYYMKDRTEYSSRYIDPESLLEEPLTPLETTYEYFQVGFQYRLGDDSDISASKSTIDNSSNDPYYEYSKTVYSVGISFDF